MEINGPHKSAGQCQPPTETPVIKPAAIRPQMLSCLRWLKVLLWWVLPSIRLLLLRHSDSTFCLEYKRKSGFISWEIKPTTLLLSRAAATPTVDGVDSVDPQQVTPRCRDTNQTGGARGPPLPLWFWVSSYFLYSDEFLCISFKMLCYCDTNETQIKVKCNWSKFHQIQSSKL